MAEESDPPDPATIPTLIDWFREDNVATRREAITRLETAAAEYPSYVAWGAGTIRECLGDANPEVRATACRIVGRVGLTEAREQLRNLRLDSNITVSEAARDALTHLDQTDPVTPATPPEPEDDEQTPLPQETTSDPTPETTTGLS